MGPFRLASSKFRNTLKRRRSGSISRSRILSLPVEDVRDERDQRGVEELRRVLLAQDLLPPQHDDYHVLLRWVLCSFLRTAYSASVSSFYL